MTTLSILECKLAVHDLLLTNLDEGNRVQLPRGLFDFLESVECLVQRFSEAVPVGVGEGAELVAGAGVPPLVLLVVDQLVEDEEGDVDDEGEKPCAVDVDKGHEEEPRGNENLETGNSSLNVHVLVHIFAQISEGLSQVAWSVGSGNFEGSFGHEDEVDKFPHQG